MPENLPERPFVAANLAYCYGYVSENDLSFERALGAKWQAPLKHASVQTSHLRPPARNRLPSDKLSKSPSRYVPVSPASNILPASEPDEDTPCSELVVLANELVASRRFSAPLSSSQTASRQLLMPSSLSHEGTGISGRRKARAQLAQ
jgi:hypothetical protein